MVRQTADPVRMHHCVSRSLRLGEAQTPIRAAGSEEQKQDEQKQGPISAVQTLGQPSTLPKTLQVDAAVAAAVLSMASM